MSRTRGLGEAGLAALLLGALVLALLHPVLRCLGGCFVDLERLHGEALGGFMLPDTRLNAWILAWDQHALLHEPLRLFDTNCFHPAALGLTGSEHLLGLAAPLLPLRWLSAEPVLLHQAALVLSFLGLALSTFALVRWLTGSTWAAFAAGAISAFMPWRLFEASHLQLLSLHWFPLVWLLHGRLLFGEGSRRDTVALCVLLAIQLLSSFYLAYFLVLSTALLVLAVRLQQPVSRRAALRLLAAWAPALALLVLVSVPYVVSAARGLLEPGLSPQVETGPGGAWSMLAPKASLPAPETRSLGGTYYVPLLPALLGLLGLGSALLRERSERVRRMRIFSLALAGVALGAFVLMMGREAEVGGRAVALPAQWLAYLIPGFARLRAPFRWGALIGVSAPVLAGIGLVVLEAALRPRLGRGAAPRLVLRAAVAALLAANVPLRVLPAAPAWPDGHPVPPAHRAVAQLDPAPVLELPWPPEPVPGSLRWPSAYALASAAHWHPMLDGFTGYKPRPTLFLRRLARRLPDPRALDALRRLSGLRWVVVHLDLLGPLEQRRWEEAPKDGLREVRRAGATRIYEVRSEGDGNAWSEALRSSDRRPQTFAGLSREPLPPDQARGALDVATPPAFQLLEGWFGARSLPARVELVISNRSERTWPGLDIERQGLVELEASFRDARGREVLRTTAPLDADVPPDARTAVAVWIGGPTEPGRYGAVFRLVQHLGDRHEPLPVPAVATPVEVEPFR